MNTILTGDRPTGQLHLGHYVGSLKKRVEMQDDPNNQLYIMIADMQALTDNAKNPQKVSENILQVALDYLAIGLDPTRSTFIYSITNPSVIGTNHVLLEFSQCGTGSPQSDRQSRDRTKEIWGRCPNWILHLPCLTSSRYHCFQSQLSSCR